MNTIVFLMSNRYFYFFNQNQFTNLTRYFKNCTIISNSNKFVRQMNIFHLSSRLKLKCYLLLFEICNCKIEKQMSIYCVMLRALFKICHLHTNHVCGRKWIIVLISVIDPYKHPKTAH